MVEWKQLGEVANLVRGKVISKDYINIHEGEFPVYSSQTANNGILGRIDSFMFDGDYLTWTTDGAYAGTIFRRNGKFNITNVCGLINITDNRVNQDFLYYWLCIEAKKHVLEGMGNPKLMSNVAARIRIPVPSLSEQNRIVGILDTFTASIDNLKQQIEQRKKQYEHYRDILLFSDELNAIVADVAEFGKGKIDAIELTEYNYVSVENLLKDKAGKTLSSTVPSEGNWSRFQSNDILIGNIRPYLRKIWLADLDGGTNGDVVVIRPNNRVIPRYLYYVLSSERFFVFYNQTAKGGKMPRGEKKRVLEFDLYLPNIEIQNKIVAILDKFEDSISNLEQQLEQRQKQYEYYRNKLLTFE